MKERFREEIPRWMRLLGAWRINTDSIDFNWGYFAPRAGLEFVINRGTYFDQRWAINLALGWGKFMFYLPFKTKLEEGCDLPKYGFAVHHDTFWIYKGGYYDESIGQVQDRNSSWSWYLPFFAWEFDWHKIKGKDGNWHTMGRGRLGERSGIDPWDFRKESAYAEVHPYTYKLKSGVEQERTATCTVEERKWHRKWFPYLTKIHRVIDIEFNEEVGERSGSWKGGVLGCSYPLQQNESVLQCLKRMEVEREL